MTFSSCRTGRSRHAADSNPAIIQVPDGKQLSETWPEDVRPQPWTEGIWEGRGLRNLTVELLFPGLAGSCGVQRGRGGGEQVVHDARGLAVQAQPQGDVIVDAVAGECAQQDDGREQRDQPHQSSIGAAARP